MKIIGQLKARLGLDKKQYDKGLKGAKAGANKFGSAMKKIGKIIAGAFAIKIIAQWGKATLNAYKEQRSAELKLRTIMRDRMKLGKDAFKRITKQTSEYQKQGIIGDEIQLAGVQQLATFVKQEKALSNMMPAMNNLLAQQRGYNAQAGDAVNIANMMGRVLTGQVSALSRVGISFSEVQGEILKTGTELEKTATLSQVITDNVGNMNEELAKTDLGKIQTFRNLWGDLKEWIGGKIVPGLAKMATLFSKLITPKASKQLRREQEELNLLIGVITDELTLKKDRLTLIQRLNKEYPSFLENLNDEKVTNKELTDRLKEVNTEYNKKIKIAIKEELISKQKAKLAKLFEKQLKKQNTIERIQKLIQEERFTELERNYGRNLRNAKKAVKGLQDERQEIYNVVAATMKLVEAELKLIKVGETGEGKTGGKPGRTAPGKIAPVGGSTIDILGLGKEAAASMDIETNALASMNPILEKNIELHKELAKAMAMTAEQGMIIQSIAYMSADAISGLGEAFGGLFSDMEGGFKSVVTGMIQGIQSIINALLAEAIAAMLAKEAHKGIIGLATGALGVGILAALWKSKVPEFGEGGVVPPGYPGDMYPALLSSGERVTPPGKLPISSNSNRLGNQNVKFIIEKDQLVGVLEMYNNQKNNF